MAADWQQYLQSVIFGVVFSFLLAKLFSVIFSFHEDDLSRQTESESKPEFDGKSLISSDKVVEESATISDHGDSDDDWEGVESTELDEAFSAATAFVVAMEADRAAQNLSNEVQLQLHGLYKISTEGPCSAATQPSVFKMAARAKWQAWKKLGAMPPEEAMRKYIDIVTGLYPSWAASSAVKKQGEESSHASSTGSKEPMGPVSSTFIYEEPGSESKIDATHTFAREGDEEKLLNCTEIGVPLNLKDIEGHTPLHWAVDRGHENVTVSLSKKNAGLNAKDHKGQTALHHAAVCERSGMAELLVEHGADIGIKDDEGNTPSDL